MLAELKQVSTEETVMIFEDNTACAQWAKMDGLDHNRTKHIEIRWHMIRDNVKKKKVHIDICPTQEMVADIMTKPLGFDLHQRATLKMMGYVDIISKPGQKLSGALIRNDPDVVILTLNCSEIFYLRSICYCESCFAALSSALAKVKVLAGGR